MNLVSFTLWFRRFGSIRIPQKLLPRNKRAHWTTLPWLISLTHDLPSSLVLSLPLKNRYPRGFSVYPAASQPAVFALAGYPVHLADSQSARFSLGP